MNVIKKSLYYFVILFSVACSKDNDEPSCTPKVKADLFNSSMKVDQADDHHFMVTTQVTNLAKGSCSESSLQTFGTLKVYFGPNASVNQTDELVYEKTFSLSAFAPLEKRNLTEILNLYDLGYYHFVWTLDHQNMVDESDESNNTIVRTHWKQN